MKWRELGKVTTRLCPLPPSIDLFVFYVRVNSNNNVRRECEETCVINDVCWDVLSEMCAATLARGEK